MSKKNNTIIKKENQYHHLTLEDRAKIQALLEQKEERRFFIAPLRHIFSYKTNHHKASNRN